MRLIEAVDLLTNDSLAIPRFRYTPTVCRLAASKKELRKTPVKVIFKPNNANKEE